MQHADGLAHALTSSGRRAGEQLGEALARLAARRRRVARLVDRPARTTRARPRAPRRATRARRARSPGRAGCRRSGRLLRAGEHGQARRARRPRAEQLVACAAADDVQLGGRRAGRPREQLDRLRVLEREALEDAAHDRAGGLGRGLAGLARRTLAIRAGMSPGLANARVVGIDERAQRRARRRRARRARRTSSSGPPRPGAPALVQQPEPGHVAEQPRTVPATPPSFVRLAAKVSSVISGSVELDADERPRADAEDRRRRARGTARRRRRSRCRAWRRRSPRAAEAPVARRLRGAVPSASRRDDLRQASGDAEALEEVVGPRARARVEALRRRRVRVLADAAPQSRWCSRSGISRSASAALERRVALGAIAASSKIVLIGRSWMPVRS